MKIFCIGFQKTGTTSLGLALQRLGYKVCGPVGVTNPDIKRKALSWAVERVPEFDAFQDNPWPILYKEMDRLYPGSKFILTTRHPRSWIKSAKKYFGPYESAAEVWIYDGVGTPIKNQKRFLKRFKDHNQEVRDYFKDRPEDFLEIDLGKGHGWQEICTFLGCPVPDAPFPFENKSGSIGAETQRHVVGLFATTRTNIRRLRDFTIQKIRSLLPQST
jgi:hypothetical protein